MGDPSQSPTDQLTETGREFYRRSWARGASGNFSVLLARKPLRLSITAAGNEKGTLDETNFLEIDDDAEILQGLGRPSDETLFHLAIYRLRPKPLHSLFADRLGHDALGQILCRAQFVSDTRWKKGHSPIRREQIQWL